MELNREQAIEILDKFDFFQGQRAGRELWAEKPFEVQEEDLKNFSKNVTSLKTFIKQLTEENESIKRKYKCTCDQVDSLKSILDYDTKVITEDTVRKMQERIRERLPQLLMDSSYLDVLNEEKWFSAADQLFEGISQIAEEIIGETK